MSTRDGDDFMDTRGSLPSVDGMNNSTEYITSSIPRLYINYYA